MSSTVRRFSPLEFTLSGGLLCLLLMLPLSDGGRTSFARATLAVGVFCLLSVVLISRESLIFLKGLPRGWLGLVGLLTVSSFFASIFRDFTLKESLALLSIVGGSLLAAHHMTRRGGRQFLLVALLGSGVLVTLVAAPAYLTAPTGSQAASALSGSFHYPNGLGSFLLLFVFLPFASIFHSGKLPASLASVVIVSSLFGALILTHSRGVWAAGMVALAAWSALEWTHVRTHLRRISLAIILIVSLVLVASRRPADIAPRFVSLSAVTSSAGQDTSFQWRRDIYAWTLDIIRDHPLTGTGIGTFPIAIKLYQRAPYVTGLYAHSHYLQTAAEMGLPGLAVLLLFLGILFRRAWRIITSLKPGSRERSLAVGLAAGLLGSSIHAGVDLGWSYPAVALIFGVEAAMLFSLAPQALTPDGRTFPAPAGIRILRVGLLSLCLVMAVLAGTRYYAEFVRNMGKLRLDAGQWDQGVALLGWASRLNPLSYSYRHLLASAYAARGDVGSSLRVAEAAFRLNPYDGDAYHALAQFHWLAGLPEKAESEFLSALRLGPYVRLAFYYDLAELSLAVGKRAEAEAWLRKGIEIFRPETVTSRLNRCLAPGDRYILARMYWRLAENSRTEGRVSDGKQAEELAERLARPVMEEICFRAMKGRHLSPEATIVAYWQSRGQRDWPGVAATFAEHADQRFKDESLLALPSDIETVEVDWVVSLVGNEEAANIGYEVKLVTRNAQVRRAAFTDSMVVEREGWRLYKREVGLK